MDLRDRRCCQSSFVKRRENILESSAEIFFNCTPDDIKGLGRDLITTFLELLN